MDEKKQEQVRKQAREILDKFAASLDKVKTKKEEDFYVDRDEFEREEKEGSGPEDNFKELMLQNAPSHDEDFVLAEKGSWK